MTHERGAYREMEPLPEGRIQRVCPSHRVALIERDGVPFCPWQAGHYPDKWVVRDLQKPGHEMEASAEGADVKTAAAWRASIGTKVPPKPAAAPPAPAAAAERKPSRPAPSTRPTKDNPAAAARPPEGGNMPTPRCSNCGGNGHNVRTCSKERAGAAAAGPSAAPARKKKPRASQPTSTALVLGKQADLQALHDKLESDLQELKQAIKVFGLIEDGIPDEHVERARDLLVAAGLAKEAVAGRDSIVLGKIVAAVAAVLFAADGPRVGQRKVDALVIAADAITG